MVLAAEKGLAHLGDEATIAAERQRQLKKENKEKQRRKKKAG
jgi:hypothetical protein